MAGKALRKCCTAWWEERKIGSALEDGNAERDNVRDLLSEDDEVSQHYTPVDLHTTVATQW